MKTPTYLWVLSVYDEGYPTLFGVYSSKAKAQAAANEQSESAFGEDEDRLKAPGPILAWATLDEYADQADEANDLQATLAYDKYGTEQWLLQRTELDCESA